MTAASHYDTLKVARNAPPEVIYEAYKALAQKYHPDKNLNNPEASTMMQNVNAAYTVLSDVQKRQTHDAWLRQQDQPVRALTAQEREIQAQADKAAADAAVWTALAAKAAKEVKTAKERAADAANKAKSGGASWAAWAAQAAKALEEELKKAAAAEAKAREELEKVAAIERKSGIRGGAASAVTHYDTLKIARGAPVEVVRAAYKALAQKYNTADGLASAEAVRSIQAINVAYKILSDAKKRAEYDSLTYVPERPSASHSPSQPQAPVTREPTVREREFQARADKAAALAAAAIAWADKAGAEEKEATAKAEEAARKAQEAKTAKAKDVAVWTAWAAKMAVEAKEAKARAEKAAATAKEEKWKSDRAEADNNKVKRMAADEAAAQGQGK